MTDEALAALAETVQPQGLVAVCEQVDVPLAEALAKQPAAGRGGRRDPRPGQRRHRPAHRRRGRRGRGDLRRRRGRPLQRQVRPRVGRAASSTSTWSASPLARGGRALATRPLPGARHHRLRRRRPRRPADDGDPGRTRPPGCSARRRTALPEDVLQPPTAGSGCPIYGGAESLNLPRPRASASTPRPAPSADAPACPELSHVTQLAGCGWPFEERRRLAARARSPVAGDGRAHDGPGTPNSGVAPGVMLGT